MKRVVVLNPRSKNGLAVKAFERLRGGLEKGSWGVRSAPD